MMKEGQPFNIACVQREVSLPLAMADNRSLSPYTKILYGLLAKYAGSVGYCSPTQERLAKDLGVSKILIRKAVCTLKKQKYIMTQLVGYHKPCMYYFLWRDEFTINLASKIPLFIDPELHKKIAKKSNQPKKIKGRTYA